MTLCNLADCLFAEKQYNYIVKEFLSTTKIIRIHHEIMGSPVPKGHWFALRRSAKWCLTVTRGTNLPIHSSNTFDSFSCIYFWDRTLDYIQFKFKILCLCLYVHHVEENLCHPDSVMTSLKVLTYITKKRKQTRNWQKRWKKKNNKKSERKIVWPVV